MSGLNFTTGSFTSWDFPQSEVLALMHLNSVGSVSGQATNTFTTMDVLSALGNHDFDSQQAANFDFQLTADSLNNQETDDIGQLSPDDLLTALYWNFPVDSKQVLAFFNQADRSQNETLGEFTINHLIQAVGFQNDSTAIDWEQAADDLNDRNHDSSDENEFTATVVKLAFGFGTADSGLALAYLNLHSGINMISLANQPQTAYSARSLIEHIHSSKYPDGGDANVVPGEFVLDESGNPTTTPITDVNWIIRYDLIGQNFEAYVWDVDNMQADVDDLDGDGDVTEMIPNFGFPLEGGVGYLVNVSSARAIPFLGSSWEGVLNPLTPPSLAPSLELETADVWAFILLAQLPQQLRDQAETYEVKVTNLATGRLLAESDGRQAELRLPIVDSMRQSIVHQGDLIRVEVSKPGGKRVADSQFVIQPQDLARAYRRVDLQYNPIPDLTSLLQNYPNPFNPETWIPFELSQEAEVAISIYDVSGQQVWTLPIGFKPAGIYSSAERAI
ncbi:MAG: hypothetical protein QGG54_16540, partial [Gammaproteobacteria bacterium]|nr:hypothetical protein [Gammaproteobacteria bacterium]